MAEIDDGSRRYKCPSCLRSFKRSEHCRRHSRRHTQERPYACRYCDRRYSRRDLATRHEKTLHVDQYAPPDRTHQESPLAGSRLVSPPSGPTPSPSSSQLAVEVGSQTGTVTASQPAEDHPEAQAWTSLLGLDGFDPFPNDSSLEGLSFLGSSAADAFPLDAMDFSALDEPSAPRQNLQSGADIHIPPTPARSRPWIPPSPETEGRVNSPQPWPPPLPSLGPESSPVRISDAVVSSLRNLLGEEDHQVPTPAALRLFLGTYFEVFNVHLPLLHVPSFDCDAQPPGLLLAMAATGALYRLERRAFALLYSAADAAAPIGATIHAGSFHRSERGTSSEPTTPGRWNGLAYYQTRLLLQYVGILGGKPELAERSLGMIAELPLSLYRTSARQLKLSGGISDADLTWASWLDRECTKRTLYGVWHLSDFVASTFGIAPPLTIGHDGQLELPCSEALWQARNETEWKEARLADIDHGRSATTTVREASALLVGGSDQESPPITDITALQWSPFAVVSIMHILSTQLWHMNHGSLSGFTAAKPGSPVAPESAEGDAQMSVAKLFVVGRRCHDLIRAYSDGMDQGGNKNAGRHAKDAKWQLANAADVLRICYGRTMPALAHLDCDSLLRGGLGDVTLAIQEFVAVPLERNAEFTLAASMAYEGLCIPLRYGAHFFRKAGALNGSLENLVAGWDSALLVSKWVHIICAAQALGTELDKEERELLQSISSMLRQEETEPDESSPLAARLLRYWAGFYDDTWVWGVAPRMAVVLRKLASAYDSGR